MLRLVCPRIKFLFAIRMKTTHVNLIDELNQIKSKDLLQIFNEQQIKEFMQLKRSFGGKFQSFEQLKSQSKIQIDYDKFVNHLLSLQKRNNDSSLQRIHIEPRLTPKIAAEIDSVCSVDYTASYLNWTIVKLTNNINRFEVKSWNSIKIDIDRKFHFLKIYEQLSRSLEMIPLSNADAILIEQTIYRFANPKLISYITQLQQIRAIFNTLVHCQSLSTNQSVYHISGRDVGVHFGLFVGNEQSSGEFFLTNLIFNNIQGKETFELDVEHDMKVNFHRINQQQKEPMAQCLLRAIAFLQCVNEKQT